MARPAGTPGPAVPLSTRRRRRRRRRRRYSGAATRAAVCAEMCLCGWAGTLASHGSLREAGERIPSLTFLTHTDPPTQHGLRRMPETT